VILALLIFGPKRLPEIGIGDRQVQAGVQRGGLVDATPGGLEEEAEAKGGVEQVLADHFAKVYKVAMSLALAA
jgi:hypothetical protein